MVIRKFNIPDCHSFFLFGARGTGKTTALKQAFSPDDATWFDLLDPDTEAMLARDPNALRHQLQTVRLAHPQRRWVVIDEIQKVPKLLDVVHSLIEEKHFFFAMTGSSARKLKRGQANLLAGRAFVLYMFPCTADELGPQWNQQSALEWGTLPSLLTLSPTEHSRYLRSYCHTYLKEEVVAEQLVRRVDPFRAFLEIAAQTNGTILNYSKIARDVDADTPTVQSYFDILTDTLLGFPLSPHHVSIRKRQRTNPKYYLFDLGVTRALQRSLDVPVQPGTYAYGRAFEHLVIAEIMRANALYERDYSLTYLRTKDGVEIDCLVSRPGIPTYCIEIKSTTRVHADDVRPLATLSRDIAGAKGLLLSNDPVAKIIDGIECLEWRTGLAAIGLGTHVATSPQKN